MTAANAAATTSVGRRVPLQPVTQGRAVRSEWIKLTTLRSTWLTLAVAVLGTVIVGAAAGWDTNDSWDHLHPDEIANFSPVDISLTGVVLAQLIVAVLGVLVVTGEYATGMIRTSMSAVPRRLPVLRAKLLVFGAIIAVAMLFTVAAAFVAGQVFLQTHGSLSAPHALASIVGATFYLTVVGVIAVAVGFVVRSTAGGIAVVVAVLLVLPALQDVLPVSWQTHVMPYLPSNAGSALYSVHPDQAAPLHAVPAVITLLVWAAAAMAAAVVALRRRDV